jgi:hypothetical protein
VLKMEYRRTSGNTVAIATFIPLTLLGIFLQLAFYCYQSAHSIGAALFEPIFLMITSPLWLALGVGDKAGLVGLFLPMVFVAMAFAAIGSYWIASAADRAASDRD